MKCARSQELLSAFLDHELDDATSRALTTHLTTCEACANELQALQHVKLALRDVAPARCPDSVWIGISRKLADAPPPVIPRRGMSSGTPVWALAAAAMLAISVVRPSGSGVGMLQDLLSGPPAPAPVTANPPAHLAAAEGPGAPAPPFIAPTPSFTKIARSGDYRTSSPAVRLRATSSPERSRPVMASTAGMYPIRMSAPRPITATVNSGGHELQPAVRIHFTAAARHTQSHLLLASRAPGRSPETIRERDARLAALPGASSGIRPAFEGPASPPHRESSRSGREGAAAPPPSSPSPGIVSLAALARSDAGDDAAAEQTGKDLLGMALEAGAVNHASTGGAV